MQNLQGLVHLAILENLPSLENFQHLENLEILEDRQNLEDLESGASGGPDVSGEFGRPRELGESEDNREPRRL